MSNQERQLNEKCDVCNHESMIEENRDYNGEFLAVSVCPVCHHFDWMLPKNFDEEEEDTLALTEKWAEKESKKILQEHDVFYRIDFSEPARILLTDEGLLDKVKKPIMDLCDVFGISEAFVNQYGSGIKISLREEVY